MLKLVDTEACAVNEKDGADTEGAYIAPAAPDVYALRL